ncbi:exocyst complex component Sec6 [Fomitiporia mediterranea MF3/22]|uniref:exocyst complex component Sec6 n=1 Tax=Fomitiporia mediterranea (strain MF3/22) TaxID=694068 RepID=UPI0004407C5E|nr:exocyst complex component Sec6 [Fomitiporia mediterranea MF3/22]EJD07303.1 exocyst complex component Sec6 [Fomitiporia mediterranea MF3/22]
MTFAAFRKKLEKEKASIDARLKTGVKEQLEATRDGLRKLLGTRTNVQAIKDEMATIDGLCKNPQNTISTFDQIARVSMVHRNFEQVEEMVNNLTEMHDKLDMLEGMLNADRQDITGPARNLLILHIHLTQLENFRNQTLHQAKKATTDSRAILNRWFERLNKFVANFEEYFADLSRNILPIVRAGHSEVVVKLVKIAEIEGKEDEKAIAIRLVKKAAKMDAASKFRSLQANARVIKHYRSKLTKNVTDSIKASFEEAYRADEEDPAAFVENLNGWMYKDLVRIENDVVPCFPQSWDIHSLYIREYHKALNDSLKKIVASKPDPPVLLIIHGWLKEHKKNMKELGVPPEWLEPPLLGGNEQSLIEDYLQTIISKLDEWTDNLMAAEKKTFITRSDPPEVDADGLYGMQGAVDLFQMVNQQVDLAMESGQGGILARVVTESARAMRGTQEQWVRLVETEYKKQVEKPDEVAGGLGEYCIALANDQIKCADYAEALSGRLEPLVSEKYKVVIVERLNDAIDGYLDVAKKCTQTLIDIVFNDLKPALKQLFQPAWYDGNVGQIIETMRDYMSDYQQYLNSAILELLVEDLLDAFLVAYLTGLGNATKLRMPAATDRIRDDVSLAFKFFSTLKPAKELEAHFEVVELVLALLEASKSLVFLSFWEFAKVHGPNIPFVEGLMKARDDLDRTAVSEVMESVKRKVKEEGLTDPPEPTIMKKIAIQGTFARLLRTAAS